MRRLLPLLCLSVLACDRQAPATPETPDEPPNGRGRYTDDSGQDHTVFRPLGVIAYGDDRTGTAPDARVLLGYEFEARSGARPVIGLTLPKGERGGVALYGPRGRDGLWDNALGHVVGEGTLALAGLTIDVPGMYFVLIRALDDRPLDYTLRLRCEGDACDPPSCDAVEPCDLVCASGYRADAADCRLCACEEDACDCADDERCVDGECRPVPCSERCPAGQDPVCGADDQTYRTPCTAECAGVEVVQRGECRAAPECAPDRPCSEGETCVRGRCIVEDCGCPVVRTAVCSTEGEVFANRCLLECRGAAFAYPGPCVEGYCRTPDDCAPEALCQPLQNPENRRRCAANPRSIECIRHCVPQPTCGPDGPVCRPDQLCYAPGDRAVGHCIDRCRADGDNCRDDRVCAQFPGLPDGTGICARPCHPDRSVCEAPLVCGVDAAGQDICRPPCDCPEPTPEQAVCAGGRDFASPCQARCAGFREIERGPCEPDPPACACDPARGPMLCGDDHRIYASACDARCSVDRAGPVAGCLPEVALRCAVDADCVITGCERSVCAAAQTRVCPEYSPAAACRVEAGACGCAAGLCSFRLDRAGFECQEALRRSIQPEMQPDAP